MRHACRPVPYSNFKFRLESVDTGSLSNFKFRLESVDTGSLRAGALAVCRHCGTPMCSVASAVTRFIKIQVKHKEHRLTESIDQSPGGPILAELSPASSCLLPAHLWQCELEAAEGTGHY
jgi:hypothetical protein